jgi:DNA-binding transcriptional MerR regulator
MGYFEDALSNFVQDFQYGGAIRHLTDLGYTAKEIREKLKCPFDTVRIQEIQYKYLLEQERLITEEQLRDKGAIGAGRPEQLFDKASELAPEWSDMIIDRKEYDFCSAEKILLEMYRQQKDNVYLDFPYGRMGEEKKSKVQQVLTDAEKTQLQKIPWYPKRTFLQADESWIRLSVHLNHMDVLYSTYYFLKPAITVLANANGEYLFFTSRKNVVQ